MAGQRADARRNHARVLEVAEREVAAHGADASLEQIARTAGVGSATVRRHFPTRASLLEAVSHARVEALAERARTVADAAGGRDALVGWLSEVVDYCVTARGLAAALKYNPSGADATGDGCSSVLEQAAARLLEPAVDAGEVRPEITAHDLIALVVGIALVTEGTASPGVRAQDLLGLAVRGVAPGA